MTYDLSPRLFVEHGAANEASAAAARNSSARAWQALPRERRILLVDSALKSAA